MLKRVLMPRILQPFLCEDIIRIGKNHDGGYLINKKDVEHTEVLLSFGIGSDTSFEQDFYRLKPVPIIAYDSTVDQAGTSYIQHIQENISGFNIDAILDEHHKIFLKCDIDGHEYKILDKLIEYSDKFTGIVIEFHGIIQYKKFQEMSNLISKLKQKLIHTHINNYAYAVTDDGFIPDVLELSFSSSDNIQYDMFLSLPHSLDMPNNPTDSDFEIVFERAFII